MALQPFTDPTNEIGAYFTNGVRTGPNIQAASVVAPDFTTPTFTSRSLSYGLGPGAINAASCWYRFNPASPADSVINSGILLTTIAAGLPYSVPLQTNNVDSRGTQYFTSDSGNPALQFDVPRTGRVTLSGLTAGTGVQTAFSVVWTGIDIWGQPLTSQTDGVITSADVTAGATFVESPSAFWQLTASPVVTALTIGAGMNPASTATMVFNAGGDFGLPYALQQPGNLFYYSQWDNVNDVMSGPLFPAYIQTTGAPFVTLSSYGVPSMIQRGLATSVTPTATTPDVRGLISPNTFVKFAAEGEPTLEAGDGFAYEGPIYVMYAVEGADYQAFQQNQLLAQVQSSLNIGTGSWDGFGKSLNALNTTDNPTLDDLIGRVPYSASA